MIKVVEDVKPKAELEYPCLMVGAYGSVILFRADKCGTVLTTGWNSKRSVGEYRTDWIMDAFQPYTGALTLSNPGNSK